MTHLAMVYDADGGVVGEVRYVVGHLLGRTECSLCDITHGPLKRKAAFDALVDRLTTDGHVVEVHHRNEQTSSQARASAGHLPCVLAADSPAGPWRVLVDAAALRRCAGDVDALAAVLDEAITAAGR